MKKLFFIFLIILSAAARADIGADFLANTHSADKKYFARDLGSMFGANDYTTGPSWEYGINAGASYTKLWGDNGVANPSYAGAYADFYKIGSVRAGGADGLKAIGAGASFLHPAWSGIEGAYGGVFYDFADADSFSLNHVSLTVLMEVKELSESYGDFSFNTYLKAGADLAWLKDKAAGQTINAQGFRASIGSTFLFANLASKGSSLNLAPAVTAEYTYTGHAHIARGALSIFF